MENTLNTFESPEKTEMLKEKQESFQQGNCYLFVIIKSNEHKGRFLIKGRHMKKQIMKNYLCNSVATFISPASRLNLLQCY